MPIGVQVLGYIKFFRLMKGRELLHLSDMPLQEIAHYTHYADVRYFVKEYKKVFLIHPKYRSDYLPCAMDEEE